MSTRRFLFFCFCVAVAAFSGPPMGAQDWTWQQVAPGVVAALQPDEERFDDANVVFIDWGEDGLIMVDAPAKTERLDQLLDQLAERTSRQVRWLINTHWHSDHTQGNEQIRARLGAEIGLIGHRTLAEDVPARAAKQITARVARLDEILPPTREQLKLGRDQEGNELAAEDLPAQEAGIARAEEWLLAHRELRFLTPEVAMGDALTLHDGARRIEVHSYVAHTRGDLVVYLPGTGVLITGDVVDDLPYIGHGYPRSWLETLSELSGLEPKYVIPGHGPVFEGRQQVDKVHGFLADLLAQVTSALVERQAANQETESSEEQEVTFETLGEDLDLSQWDLSQWRKEFVRDAASERFFDGVLAEAIQRTVDDLTGTLDGDAEPAG